MAQKNPSDLLRAYLVVGTDELKRSATVKKLSSYIPAEWEDFCIAEFAPSDLSEPNELIDALQALPFGADIRLVILHDIGSFTKEFSEPLIEYLKNPNPQCVLCCEGETLLKTTRLYKALAAIGPKAVIECNTAKTWDLPPYVIKLAAQHELTLDVAAASELVERLGDNTYAIENQLKMFVELYGRGAHITKQIVDETVAQVADIKPWAIADALCERNVAEALRLSRFIKEDEYIRSLFIITTRLREIVGTQCINARGMQGSLASEIGINPKITFKYQNYARNYSPSELRALIMGAATCEAALKSSPDKGAAFTQYLLSFAR